MYRFEKALDELKEEFVQLISLVEKSLDMVSQSFSGSSQELVDKVRENDLLIDEKEVKVEEECLKILALYHPLASDLRFIVSILKVNNDLERIGDHALAVTKYINKTALVNSDVFTALPEMADQVKSMLKKSLDAFIHRDYDLAKEVCLLDDFVDELKKYMQKIVVENIQKDVSKTDEYLVILLIARHLERIADLSTNIAEDAMYLIEGKIVRHYKKLNT